MSLNVQVPQTGQPNSTEDVKVSNSLVALSAWANGNIPDTDLLSPNNSVRRCLLQTSGSIVGIIGANTLFSTASGTANVNGNVGGMDVWIPDEGLSSQPTDFQVANKSPFCRIRAVLCVNSIAPAVTFTIGLYQLVSLAGSGGSIAYTFGSVLAGSTVAVASPVQQSAQMVETGQFAMPISGNPYAIGVATSGSTTANSLVTITAQLYGYNG